MRKLAVVFIDSLGNSVVKNTNHVPRIGDKVGIFNYRPLPQVRDVLWWPDDGIKKLLKQDIDVVITVG